MKTDIWAGDKSIGTYSQEQFRKNLLDDDFYYDLRRGGLALSASTLSKYYDTDCPKDKEFPPEAALFGRWFHGLMLEPNKYDIEDAPIQHREHLRDLMNTLKDHYYWNALIKCKGFKTEIPYVKKHNGIWSKCKVDIETDNSIYDIKTTSSLSGYEWMSRKVFKYPLSAYHYYMLTGKTMTYIVIEKGTGKIEIHKTDAEYYREGFRQWCWAMRNYQSYKKKHWQFMGLHDNLPQGRFKLDSVHMSGEENRLYAWILKEEYLNKKKR